MTETLVPQSAERDAIKLSPSDNVATLLRPVAAGEPVGLGGAGPVVTAREPIPLCHKVALARIPVGSPVTKYGQPIGIATETVEPGRHVHVHNMRSARAQAERRDG